MPIHKVVLGGQDHWFFTLEERDAFLKQKKGATRPRSGRRG